ncbi:MAG TPA: AAA family ATPase [archaeon]|nr:AAA family ATPase [archaeon]
MLLEKYSPKTVKELIGNPAAIMDIRKFLTSWKKGKALLVYGPTGSGKSTSIRLVASELDYEVIGTHADEERSVKGFFEASMQRGVFSRKKVLLFDDVTTGSLRNFSQLIEKSEHPVICTTDDAYQLSAASRKNFKLLKFGRIAETDMIRFLEIVCKNEHIALQHRELEQLTKTSNGDIRALLIDLDTLRLGLRYNNYRDAEENIFNTLKVIFKTTNIQNCRMALDNEKDSEELFRWLEQNVVEEYTDINSIATAYDYLSKADIFSSRIIKRQSWSLQKYFSNLSAYGVALAKEKASARFVSYRPPVFVRRSGNVMLENLARNLHISRRQAAAYIPIIRMLFKKNRNIGEELGMNDKESSFILD